MSGKSLKVVVEINEAYPLLHSAFARIPANVRSERLRALAMIGMYPVSYTHLTLPTTPYV